MRTDPDWARAGKHRGKRWRLSASRNLGTDAKGRKIHIFLMIHDHFGTVEFTHYWRQLLDMSESTGFGLKHQS